MARSDLILTLVKAGAVGDSTLFRKAVEAMVADERAKNHAVFADRLHEQLNATQKDNRSVVNGFSGSSELFHEIAPKRGLSSLVLPETTLQALTEIVEEHQRAELLKSYGLEPRNRILLSGPPGNGKTAAAETIAFELMIPLFTVRYEGLITSYLGETASRLRRLFDHVRTRCCVLFFDEFDAIGKERGDTRETGEIKRVVSSLLMQIDDLPSHVVVITATNHRDLLDRAVWRRFQSRLELPAPTAASAQKFLESAVSQLPFSPGVSVRTLANKLAGASFSELEEFVADVARRYVLTQPDGTAATIVRDRLRQWQKRVKPPADTM